MQRREMAKGKKAVLATGVTAAILIVAVLIGLIVSGYMFSFGPFGALSDMRFGKLEGNAEEYSLDKVRPIDGSPLEGKNIAFLGSSVTLGASSLRVSFADYIAKRNGADYVKDAVSGTTLADKGVNSYIARMKKMDKREEFDLFIVQLSTNDATQKVELGEVKGAGEEYDKDTVCGAIEYIIEYVASTWQCPVVAYTNAYYESKEYAAMVQALYKIRDEYGIGVIDLYTDEAFNDITEEQRSLYMADEIHPTKAGYLEWWTPRMEEYLYEFVK